MEQNDFEAATATIAKIHSRWKEAATGDVLEGQLALKRSNIPLALQHFNEALEERPREQDCPVLEGPARQPDGPVAEASKAFEDLVKDRPTKEVDTGVTLMTAAQSALANLALQRGDTNDAIRRFEELKRNNEAGNLSRSDRWQLITAYVLKGQWPVAKRELASLLNDNKTLATDDERVRGRQLLPSAQGRRRGTGAARLRAEGQPCESWRGGDPLVHLPEGEEVRGGGRHPSQGDRAHGGKKDKPPAVLYLMLAAVENEAPPAETAGKRAATVLEQGLAIQPNSVELVQAEYLLRLPTDPKGALAVIDSKAKADPKGPYRRMLVDVLREQREYEKADKLLRELVQESPDDVNLAAALVQVVSLEAGEAAAAGNTNGNGPWTRRPAR